MKAFARILSTSLARGFATMCAALLGAAEDAAQAGVNVWTSHGPPSGDVRVLAIDPTTPSTLYVGTLSGSVFKSVDAGATWGATGLTGTYSAVSALAVDPATPDTLYAGTGKYDAAVGDIVFKSTDAGATWAAGAGATTSASASPRSAGDFVGVYALVIDPGTLNTIYAATSYRGVVKSLDAGATWDATGLIDTFVFALAIDPNTPSTLYAVTIGGVVKSTDAGATWGATGLTRSFTDASALVIDPHTPGTLYVGTREGPRSGILKSTDGGETWSAANAGLSNTDVRALAIDPSTPSTLYAGTGGGVFKSTDAAATWGAANTGLTNLMVVTLAIDPITPTIVHAGTNGGGVFHIQQVAGCIGDCRGDGTVTVDDLVTGVTIGLDNLPLDACSAFDVGGDGHVTIDEIIAAVHNTLAGCPTEGPPGGLSGTLFVTASAANRVYAIDAATGAALASAATEEHPVGVEKANGKVYVANETSGTVSVYDSATLSPLTAISACDKPHHTAVAPDGSRFYVACVGTNKVAVVDTETDALVDLLTSGEAAAMTHQPWPTKDGQRLWVANFGTDDITEIDLHTGAILRMFPLGARPVEVVVSANAKTAYVSIPAESKIKVFDLETNQLVAEPTVLPPENLMLSGDGKTILASYAYLRNPTVASIVDTETLTSVEVTLPGVAASHTDLTRDAKFGFVSLLGSGGPESPNGIAVLDVEAATVRAVYELPDSARPHAVRYAPGPP